MVSTSVSVVAKSGCRGGSQTRPYRSSCYDSGISENFATPSEFPGYFLPSLRNQETSSYVGSYPPLILTLTGIGRDFHTDLNANSHESSRYELPWSDLRMGRFGGEMHLPSKLWRREALFEPFSEAKLRSVDCSRGLSWFVVLEKGHVS